MRVAIVGAGAAGLASARHAVENGFECDVLEMAAQVGGTWVYTDDVDTDKHGYPVYSAMYKGLRTNLPKEIMGFPDFPIPEQDQSYLSQSEILDFLNLYLDNFNLRPLIKCNSMVTDICPLDGDNWQLTYIDKPTHQKITKVYDAVMICNGHYNKPVIPKIEGQEKFKGTIEHCHTFRSPEGYQGKRVLVIGAGPSGLDLTLQISKAANYVVLSHHCPEAENTSYPDNVDKKPDVKLIRNFEMVEFVDGSCCGFDVILLCTGYTYNFPFLNESCGITIDSQYIQPLYKHMIHIRRPTMCFIGIPFEVCAFQMFDLQARYFCKFLNGSMKLPSTEEMQIHTDQEMEMRWEMGYSKRQAHLMGHFQESYYNDLAFDANTTPIPPVMVKLRDLSVKMLYDNLLNFRKDKYRIVDNESFIKVN